jgi:tRNA-dihydrouridine synthase A
MMERTDRHCRYLLRLLAPNTLLYTEMITAAALLRGDADGLLRFDSSEHPVALQLGGSEPSALARAAALGENAGYDEINLNIGCPSDRVQAGCFGAALMARPELVADCVAAMSESIAVPVTVKTRLGIDEMESYEFLIIINGGLTDEQTILQQLDHVDGVMLGRQAYQNPYLLARLDRLIIRDAPLPSRETILESYLPYLETELSAGTSLKLMTRHLMGLYTAQPGGKRWRRFLGELPHGREGLNALQERL